MPKPVQSTYFNYRHNVWRFKFIVNLLIYLDSPITIFICLPLSNRIEVQSRFFLYERKQTWNTFLRVVGVSANIGNRYFPNMAEALPVHLSLCYCGSQSTIIIIIIIITNRKYLLTPIWPGRQNFPSGIGETASPSWGSMCSVLWICAAGRPGKRQIQTLLGS